jgi:hypothetical protein
MPLAGAHDRGRSEQQSARPTLNAGIQRRPAKGPKGARGY